MHTIYGNNLIAPIIIFYAITSMLCLAFLFSCGGNEATNTARQKLRAHHHRWSEVTAL
jgi:hypothetical protein